MQNQDELLNTTPPPITSIAPPIQNKKQEEIFQPQTKQQKSFKIINIVILVLLVAGAIIFYFFRNQLFGTLTYSDCLKVAGSTKVDLEPKYCLTPEGKIFFEKLGKRIPNSDEVPLEIDPDINFPKEL
jgi:hypothetical protein